MSNGLYMKYFILKPGGDDVYAVASRRAMQTYAHWIAEHGDDKFAKELMDWISRETHASLNRRQQADELVHSGPPGGSACSGEQADGLVRSEPNTDFTTLKALVEYVHTTHYPETSQWQAARDIPGLLAQLSNMLIGLERASLSREKLKAQLKAYEEFGEIAITALRMHLCCGEDFPTGGWPIVRQALEAYIKAI